MRPPHAKGGGARDAGRRRAMAAFIVNARATALMTALMAALMTALMAGAALAADSGEFAVSASGSGAARSCVAVFKPRLAAGEDKAPKLTLATIGRSQIAASVERPGRFSVATLVRNNIRTPFPIASGSMANEQFRASLLGKALASRQRFYVTAQLQDGGDYVSSQYEGIDFDAVLKTIESQCPFDAESLMSNIAAREKAEAALRVSKSRMTLIRWALNEKYGKGAARPAARASLSPEERAFRSECQRSCAAPNAPEQLCRMVCACTVDGLKREKLWQKALDNLLSPQESVRMTELAQGCLRDGR